MGEKYIPTVAVDFDGVLHSYTSKWTNAKTISDGPVPDAIAALTEYAKHFKVAIFSSRSNEFDGRQAMAEWLVEHGLEPLLIHESDRAMYGIFLNVDPEVEEEMMRHGNHDIAGLGMISFPEHKPAALVSIDDRAITFNGTFPRVVDIQDFKPWNKR